MSQISVLFFSARVLVCAGPGKLHKVADSSKIPILCHSAFPRLLLYWESLHHMHMGWFIHLSDCGNTARNQTYSSYARLKK